MQTPMAFHTATVRKEQLGEILSDYLAFDQARIVRRVMMVRFGLLALFAALVETLIHGFSPSARTITIALCVLPPVSAWMIELAHGQRLTRRIKAVEGLSIRKL